MHFHFQFFSPCTLSHYSFLSLIISLVSLAVSLSASLYFSHLLTIPSFQSHCPTIPLPPEHSISTSLFASLFPINLSLFGLCPLPSSLLLCILSFHLPNMGFSSFICIPALQLFLSSRHVFPPTHFTSCMMFFPMLAF